MDENIFLLCSGQRVDFSVVVEVIFVRWNVWGKRLMFVFKWSWVKDSIRSICSLCAETCCSNPTYINNKNPWLVINGFFLYLSHRNEFLRCLYTSPLGCVLQINVYVVTSANLKRKEMKLNRLFTNSEAIQFLFRMNCRPIYNLTLRRYPGPI